MIEKIHLTIEIDEDPQQLIDHYVGKCGIGHFFSELVKKYDVEEHYGAAMIEYGGCPCTNLRHDRRFSLCPCRCVAPI
jgi:hypothetical protein